MGRLALAGRILLTLLLAVLLVGFGACGLVGISVGMQQSGGAMFVMLGVAGILIAVFIASVVVSIWRNRRAPEA
ncbi:hypothetical protein IP92_00021 [Pseudoduganella flava]|uniref:DUF1328 domain-containing protein n=1 Tax=Pseudoduganella flava TaxID=871742 RepID=A0A562Q2X4_9BURK|nr:hypothetical protein [Pseudoduganella flava]QGZ41115.1 hypothetical protein GO485_20020 [Pseudoduganella flava]TWI51039.1 hypothetical protein IP92_00021 [Pseudoduganella flava]